MMGYIGREKIGQRYRERHKKKRLCILCSRKAIEGQTKCQYHSDYNKKKEVRKDDKK